MKALVWKWVGCEKQGKCWNLYGQSKSHGL